MAVVRTPAPSPPGAEDEGAKYAMRLPPQWRISCVPGAGRTLPARQPVDQLPHGHEQVSLDGVHPRCGARPVELHKRGVRVVGGGSQNAYLNQATATTTGLPVVAGPVEATVLGNVLVQGIARGRFDSLAAS